ncbi:Asi ubiquitin ligase complex subunit [Komagataella phaffii]|uniref:Uncharacterized protein n=2 Tax=Komagataella phaffii TaxID=460519 RepID=C4R866_KOMPG|nr:uncharacterized protein PAS_chr4_0976 [Komagataella phaffii GS115]AOA64366.1 GQ67_04901T0 [Komagataella phaffii]AOA70367.1 GQ68_04873T0 [Komagataella phaffii GS115]CAY71791.1 hypothetical protein PAS_chr4_0976 [Komagataella phaffii GS115]
MGPFRLMYRLFEAVMEQSNSYESPASRGMLILSYCISPFAAMCMTTAIILNRLTVFAITRYSNRKLPRISSLLIRIVAIWALYSSSYGVLVALKTYQNHRPHVNLLLSDSYFFNKDLFEAARFLYCGFGKVTVVRGAEPNSAPIVLGPSPAVFRNFYLGICVSQIIEAFVSLTNGQDPSVENGLTLFEYSVAFQEIQGSQIPSYASMVVALIALANQLLIHVLGLLNLTKYKLLPSSVIGLYGLFFFATTFYDGTFLSLPYTIYLGYFPQLVTALIILLCFLIYTLAVIFKGGSYEDLQFSSITHNSQSLNVSLSDDFYTALMNIGSFVITVSGRQSYINELSSIEVPESNFLQGDSGYNVQYLTHPTLAKLHDKAKVGLIRKRINNFSNLVSQFVDMIILLAFKRKLIVNKQPKSTSSQREKANRNAKPQVRELDIDDVTVDQYTYGMLLKDTTFSDVDNSDDYIYEESSTDDSDWEYNSDVEIETENSNPSFAQLQRKSVYSGMQPFQKQYNALSELVGSVDFRHLLSPDSLSDRQQARLLSISFSNSSLSKTHLTRSKFKELYEKHPEWKLQDLIFDKRPLTTTEDFQDSLGNCVVCQSNSRQVILWPCRCLAICEPCRVSLVMRNFKECVCCRRHVDGFSKIYIP